MVKSARANQRIDLALVESVNQRLNNDSHIVQLRFLQEGKSAGTVFRKSPRRRLDSAGMQSGCAATSRSNTKIGWP